MRDTVLSTSPTHNLDATYTYNNEGRVATVPLGARGSGPDLHESGRQATYFPIALFVSRASLTIGPYTSLSNGGQPVGNWPS